MHPHTVRVVSCALPTIEWACRCAHRRFSCSERFRINTHGKLADIWLIYRCERCGATKNVTIVERASVGSIGRRLFNAATVNDAVTARALARDVAVLKRSGVRIAEGDKWRVIDGCDSPAPGIATEPNRVSAPSPLTVDVVFDEAMLVRLDAVVASAIGATRRTLHHRLEAGDVDLGVSGRIDRLRLWAGVVAVRGRFPQTRSGDESPEPEEASTMTKREKIGEGEDARYVRRDEDGQFTEDQVNVGASHAADQRQQSDNEPKPGHGDRGDRQS